MADSTKKRSPRLGRGLSSLMSTPVQVAPAPVSEAVASKTKQAAPAADPTPAAADESTQPNDGLRYISVKQIKANPHQPRQHFDETSIASLAESIRVDGLMQPIVLRPGGGADDYELVAGERRWRAAQQAGLEQVPAVIRELDDQQSAEWALIENLQREDLNAIDRAEAFDRLGSQYKLSHEQIASRVGFERSTISNHLRLLNLSETCRDLVRQDLLSMGQARAIAGMNNVQAQDTLAAKAVREGLSVRMVEKLAQQVTGEADAAGNNGKSKAAKPAHLSDLEKQVTQQLGTKVQIRPGRKKGSGKLTIDFYSLDQFDTIMSKLGVEVG